MVVSLRLPLFVPSYLSALWRVGTREGASRSNLAILGLLVSAELRFANDAVTLCGRGPEGVVV